MPVKTTIAVSYLTITGAASAIGAAWFWPQEIPGPESLTFAGILVFVLGGVILLLRSQGKALVEAVTANTGAQAANTVKLTELVVELRTLATAEREKAVAEIKEAIREEIVEAVRDSKRSR